MWNQNFYDRSKRCDLYTSLRRIYEFCVSIPGHHGIGQGPAQCTATTSTNPKGFGKSLHQILVCQSEERHGRVS